MKKLEFQKIELTMKVGKHTAIVVCKNKKQAKQRASQHILQVSGSQVAHTLFQITIYVYSKFHQNPLPRWAGEPPHTLFSNFRIDVCIYLH